MRPLIYFEFLVYKVRDGDFVSFLSMCVSFPHCLLQGCISTIVFWLLSQESGSIAEGVTLGYFTSLCTSFDARTILVLVR